MSNKVHIKPEFKKELQYLGCESSEDYIEITRKEDGKVFFKYGTCKLHVTKEELEDIKVED